MCAFCHSSTTNYSKLDLEEYENHDDKNLGKYDIGVDCCTHKLIVLAADYKVCANWGVFTNWFSVLRRGSYWLR